MNHTFENGSPVNRQAQRGVTLIELMVGITIGLLVVLAATGTMVLNRVSANTVSDTSMVTAQANNAMRLLTYTLRNTGAFELQPTNTGAVAAQQIFNLGDPAAAAPATIVGVNGASGAPDEFTASFSNRAGTATRDCLGNQAANVHDNIPNRFFIDGVNLSCQGIAGNNAQPIAENIEDLQVMYLTEMGGGTNRWLNADGVIALGATAWNQVIAAEICIQVRGDINHGTALTDRNFVNCSNVSTAHTGEYRVVLRQTVQLRNRMNNI